jgi:DNA polymerase elongation subunit (family B)
LIWVENGSFSGFPEECSNWVAPVIPVIRDLQNLTPAKMASVLKKLAAKVSLQKFQKSKRGPKRPQPKRKYSGNGQHVATAKLLARRST